VTTAREHFAAGNLAAAIAAQVQQVKASPLDAGQRTFLFELLAFDGQLDRADAQLAVLGGQSSESGWASSVYQNLLAAERMRRAVFAGQRQPEVFLDAPDWLDLRWQAVGLLARSEDAAATQLVERSDQMAPQVCGQLNDRTVEGLRDADDLLAPILEVMVLRDYVWVPWCQVQELELAPPKTPRDLLWAPARLVLSDGQQRHVYLPTLYPDTHAAGDDAVKLGRLTQWQVASDEAPVRGIGQHLLVAGDWDIGLLEMRQFQAAG
jgi:type VI secretion system protein ImpE